MNHILDHLNMSVPAFQLVLSSNFEEDIVRKRKERGGRRILYITLSSARVRRHAQRVRILLKWNRDLI